MLTTARRVELPPLPPLGMPEAYYARKVREADAAGDRHLHESLKIGQYLTLAADESKPWPQRLKCFRHAATHHAIGPAIADDQVMAFYGDLLMLVRDQCGAAALKLASRQDDEYARQVRQGRPPGQVADDAAAFFHELMGGRHSHCEGCFHPDDLAQLKVFRAAWV